LLGKNGRDSGIAGWENMGMGFRFQMGMGMKSLKWEGIGTKNLFPHTSSLHVFLEVVSGVMAARSRRSSGSRGALELGWWYSTGLQVLLDVPTGNTAIDRTLRVQYTPTSGPN